jgi:hypothetical protein
VIAEVGTDTMMGSRPDSSTGPTNGEAVDVDGEEVDPTASSANDDTTVQRSAFWRKFAEETVRSCISLRPAPTTKAELAELVKTCEASKVKVAQGQSTVIKFYDEKLAGEALSMPNLRKPPHRTQLFQKLHRGGAGGWRRRQVRAC